MDPQILVGDIPCLSWNFEGPGDSKSPRSLGPSLPSGPFLAAGTSAYHLPTAQKSFAAETTCMTTGNFCHVALDVHRVWWT